MCRSGAQIYAALLNGGVFQSEDEGLNWRKVPGDPTGGLDLPLMTSTATSIYVSNHTTLYRLEKSSGAWTEIRQKLEPGKLNNMYLRTLSADAGRIAALGQYYTYVSADDGGTWTRNAIELRSDSWLDDMVIKGTGLYGAVQDSLYYSANNGLTWSGLLALPKPYSFLKLASGESGLWTITSQGLSHCPWNLLLPGMLPAWSPVTSRGIPSNRLSIGGLLDRGGKLWVAAPGAIFLSVNGGEDFKILPLPSETDPGLVSSLVELGTGALLGSADAGLVAAGADGVTRMANTGIHSRSITALTIHHGSVHALVSGMGLYLSRDLGRTWQGPKPGVSAGLAKGRFTVLNDRLYLVQGNAILRFEEDTGQYLPFSVLSSSGPAISLAWHLGGLFAGTEKDGLYFSGDSGHSWKRPLEGTYNNFENQTVRSIASNGKALYVTASGQYRSYLYGFLPDSSKWKTLRSTGAGDQDMNAVLARGDSLIAAGSSDVCLSLDAGATWKNLGAFAGRTNPYAYELYAAGPFISSLSGKGAAFSNDMGKTWDSLPSLGAVVSSLIKVDEGRLMAGTDGLSLWNYYPDGAPPEFLRRNPVRRAWDKNGYNDGHFMNIGKMRPSSYILHDLQGRLLVPATDDSRGIGLFFLSPSLASKKVSP